MLENNNRKFIRTLSRECMKANKIRNLIAIFAIILTTVLFTSVGTVLEGSMQTIREQRIRQSGTSFMLSMKYLSEEESERFLVNSAFSEIGRMQFLGNVMNEDLKKITVNMSWADEAMLKGSFVELKKGGLPEKDNEILIDTTVLEMLGLPEETGQSFALSYQVNEEPRQREVTVAGIYEGERNETMSLIYLSRAFFDKEMQGISIPSDGTAGAGSIVLYGSFPSEKNLDEQRSQVLKEAGFDPDAEKGEAGYIVSNINSAYGSSGSMNAGVLAGAGVMLIVIIIAGYLIISNIFRISVLKDMRMYGQLKTIGASPKQLRKLLQKQADMLNLTGIPIGLFLGYLLGEVLLPVVMKITVYSDVGELHPKVWVFAASAVFSFVTVLASCRRPAKMMSQMSPVQALRYQGRLESKRKQVRGGESRARILRMAVSNLADNKGKTFFVVLSLSLSVILLNSVLNFTATFDRETYISGLSAADFIVSNISFETRGESESFVLSQEFLDEVKQRTDVEKCGEIYCYQAPDDIAQSGNDTYEGIQTVKVLTVNGNVYPEEKAAEHGKMLYGFGDGVFERCKVVNGSLDKEKLASGKYIVEATTFINNATDYDEDAFTLKPGDKVSGEIGGVKLEYEVLANVVVNFGLLYSSSMGENAGLILPENEYLKQFPGKMPIHYVMDAKKGKFVEVDTFLTEYEQKPQANIKYESSTKVSENFTEEKKTYEATGSVLAIIFGVIGILNLLNVTLTNAVSRQQEFAVMQSIGMTRKQLRKLFVLEGLLYSVIAGGVSLILAGVLSVTAVKGMTNMYWFSVYHFTVLPACMIIPVYILAAGGIALVIDKMWNNGSVVERLRG